MSAESLEIDISETSLEELVAIIREGREIILRAGEVPIARLTPATSKPTARIANLHPGAMRISEDFNYALPDDFWMGEE